MNNVYILTEEQFNAIASCVLDGDRCLDENIEIAQDACYNIKPIHPILHIKKECGINLIDEVNKLCGAISSINSGNQHMVKNDAGDICYWQREEWVRWMLDEMLPQGLDAVTKVKGEEP